QFQFGTIKSLISVLLVLTPFLFQFQFGTIKSGKWNHLYDMHDLFQFQFGTIKSNVPVCAVHGLLYFNSSLVRLKVFGRPLPYQIYLDFNSSLVRLKEAAQKT